MGEGSLVIDFAEAFGVITKDSIAGRAGSPLQLRDWQKELIRHVFAGNGLTYRHRINLIGMPRKNGKSALGSVFGLYSLILGAKGAEVYSVAAEKEQARIVFADAKRMIESSPELTSMTKLYRDAIELPSQGSVYRVLSAEAYSKEGLNPSATIFDELHAQPSRELFDVMSLAMGARPSATLIAITTAGVRTDTSGQDSICYSLYQLGQRVARGEIDGKPLPNPITENRTLGRLPILVSATSVTQQILNRQSSEPLSQSSAPSVVTSGSVVLLAGFLRGLGSPVRASLT
jgi:phage terminase large subunit-like protein